MSISNISGSLNTSSLLYGSGGDKSLNLLNNNMDTSAISGISNIDSYVKSDLMSSQINTTYSPTMPPNPFNVSNITGALNVADSKPDLSGITNLDEYAEAAYSQSQLSVEDQLTNVQGEISGISEISNLDSNINSDFEEAQLGLTNNSSNSFSGITDMNNVLSNVYNTYKSLSGQNIGTFVDTQI